KIVDDHPRRHAALFVQLHTGHLHRILRVSSPFCSTCEEREETVHHFLMSCPAYTRYRVALKAELDTQAQSLKGLLNDRNSIKAVLKYVARSKRLVNTFGDVSPPEQKK
ncbi:hypothetical protein BDR03DRAFT_865425, partial [Suillus americanus]